MRGSETTRTPSIAKNLAQRKGLTTAILREAGLPVAMHKLVRRLETAEEAARSLGFPVVVKPADGNRGIGVSIGISTEAEIAPAFERAQAVSRGVLVERFIPGNEYRLLVVDGRFVAAALRRPAMVIGDGTSTVAELVALENARPERETILPGQMAARLPIEIDVEACELLAQQGLDQDAVPEADAQVLLRRQSNVSQGGDSVDFTDAVHPSIRTVAERAATVLGIDVCGVDFISRDVGKPWWETGAAICEVNTRPGLVLHTRVSEGERRDVASDVVSMLYPQGASHRTPVVALLEGAETPELVRSIAEAAARAGSRLGVFCRSETFAGLGSEVHRLEVPAAVAWDERIDVAVVEVSAHDVVRRGLGLERIELAVVSGGDTSATPAAVAALARTSGKRAVAAEHPETLDLMLSALGLGWRDGRARAAIPNSLRLPEKGRDRESFNVLMVGDVGFGESYAHRPRAEQLPILLKNRGHGYCFSRLSAVMRAADLIIGNLEAPLSKMPDPSLRGRKKYLGWSDPEPAAQALREAGFSAVSLANNHSLDCGVAGVNETMGRLENSGIASFGAGKDLEAAEQPFISTFLVGGVQRSIVVFAGFEHRLRYEQRYRWYARRGSSGVSEISAARIGSAITMLRERLPSPIFVAYPHWGTDYEGVTEHQRSYARALVQAGVDLVVGHGAHVAQPVEVVDGRPVVYGIGNFVWNTPGRFARRKVKPFGVAAVLRFQAGSSDEARLRLYPMLTDNSITNFRNRLVTVSEFPEAVREIAANLGPELKQGVDAIGQYLQIDVPTGGRRSLGRRPRLTVPAALPPGGESELAVAAENPPASERVL